MLLENVNFCSNATFFNKNIDEHLKRLKQLFSIIHDLNLKINKAENIFGQKKFLFFGAEVLEYEINADPSNTKAFKFAQTSTKC